MDKIKQLLKEMGLTDVQIDEFIKGAITDKFVPKHRMDEVNEKNKQLTTDIDTRDKQIKEFSKFEGDNTKLKEKITELEQLNADKDKQNQEAIKTLKIDNAINYSLNGKVKEGYDDLVRSLIDKSTIILKEDGTVAGLDEQIEKYQKDKPLLFISEEDGGTDSKQAGWNFKGDDPQDSQKHSKKSISENFVESLTKDKEVIVESTKTANDYYFGTTK